MFVPENGKDQADYYEYHGQRTYDSELERLEALQVSLRSDVVDLDIIEAVVVELNAIASHLDGNDRPPVVLLGVLHNYGKDVIFNAERPDLDWQTACDGLFSLNNVQSRRNRCKGSSFGNVSLNKQSVRLVLIN